MAKNFCLIVAKICAFPSTQLHTNSLKFESEISLKNGAQNGVRHFEGAARRRHQPPWRSVSETSARKLKQRSHRPELKAQAAFSLKGRCRRMRQRVGKENAPALRARISTDKKMAPSIAGRPFSYLWRWAESNRRPNNVPGGFLHAYPAFGCRPRNAGRRAVRGLSPGS